MISKFVVSLVLAINFVRSEYQYTFSTYPNKPYTTNDNDDNEVISLQNALYNRDQVVPLTPYVSPEASSVNIDEKASWIPELQGVNSIDDIIHENDNNAPDDSSLKSLKPSNDYFNEYYASYINFVNDLFSKHPERREGIIKTLIRYSRYVDSQEEEAVVNNFNDQNESTFPRGSSFNINLNSYLKSAPYNPVNSNYVNSLTITNTLDTVSNNQYPYIADKIPNLPNSIANTTAINQNNEYIYNQIDESASTDEGSENFNMNLPNQKNLDSIRWNFSKNNQEELTRDIQQGEATNNSGDFSADRYNYISNQQDFSTYSSDYRINDGVKYSSFAGVGWNGEISTSKANDDNTMVDFDINGDLYRYKPTDGRTEFYNGDKNLSSNSNLNDATNLSY